MGLLVFLERLAARLGSGVRNETTINGDVSHAITGGSFNRSSINIGSSAKTLVNILREQQADKEIAEFRAAVRETKDRFDRTTSISSENPFVTLSGIKFTGVPSWLLRSDARDYAVAQASLGQALISKAASLDHRRGLPYIKEAEALFREALRLLDPEQYPDEWRATQAFLGGACACLASFGSEGASFSDAIVAFRAAMDLSKVAKDHDAVAVAQAAIEECEQMLKASSQSGSSGQGADRQS